MPTLITADAPADLPAIRRLFEEYATSLDIDLCFQNFATELAGLPGNYSPPRGGLWLARVGSDPAGCLGLRPFSADTGELKRLYVSPGFRGHGIGRVLIDAAIARAGAAGYRALVLDTLASMEAAIALYRSFGFQPTAPYYPNPYPEVRYFRLELKGPPAATCGR